MTKRISSADVPYTALELRQYRLRTIADHLLHDEQLPENDLIFLIAALLRIGEGEDANNALGVNAKRGMRKSRASAEKRSNARIALSWVAHMIRPEREGGLGLSLDDAFELATAEGHFRGLSEETLRQYWIDYPEMRQPSFARPIASLPARLFDLLSTKPK